MSKQVEVTITFEDKRITIQGPEEFIRSEIDRLTRAEGSRELLTDPAQNLHPMPQQAISRRVSERTLIEEKKPRGHNEIVAVLAYALAQNGQAEFTAADVRRAYIRAGVRPPKVTAQALRDARNIADYLQPGAERGTFKLSPHGENAVLFGFPRRRTKESR